MPPSTVPEGGTPGASDWSRVRQLAVGAKIIVTVRNAWTAPRYFVAADSLELVVSSAPGQVEHIARADVLEIKTERSRVLYYALAGVLSIALPLASRAIGRESKSPVGPLLFALAAGVGVLVLIRPWKPRVIYRAP